MIDPPGPIQSDPVYRISLTASILAGLSLSFITFVLFLQTPQISGTRLALAGVVILAFSPANFYLATRILKERLKEVVARWPYAASLCLLVPLLFLPLFYKTPDYPVSPLLQPWTDLAVQYDVQNGSSPLNFQPPAVRLQMNRTVIDARSFALVGEWKSAKDFFGIDPGNTAALHWVGAASEVMSLMIQAAPANGTLVIYWDQSRSSFELSPTSSREIVLVRKFTVPAPVNALWFLSWYVLLAWLLVLGLVLFAGKIHLPRRTDRPRTSKVLLVLLALLLAAVTVRLQLESLNGGISYLHGEQLLRHNNVLSGQAQDPWQYRIFSEVVVEGLIRALRLLPVADPIDTGFIALRFLQNTAIFLLAFALYFRISGSRTMGIFAILLLASCMKNAFYDNDLSFNTYFDVIFYIGAVWLLLDRHYFWVVLLTIVAALNRETSGLIPLLLLAKIWDEELPWHKKYLPPMLSLAVFAIVFFGLRSLTPGRPLYIPYGIIPGYPMLIYNITRALTWEQLFHTLGLLPLIGLSFFFVWPRLWQRFFLILGPLWFGVHFLLSVAAETRLFLVPLTIIFIPGILFGFNYLQDHLAVITADKLLAS